MKLTIYLPDKLGAEVKTQEDLNVSAVCQRALEAEIESIKVRTGLSDDMGLQKVTLWRTNDEHTAFEAEFVGRWLVYPDPDETRTAEDTYDAGAYWGVALTERGNIFVYTAHCNDRWAPRYDVYDSTTDARTDDVPGDILAEAASQLGEDLVVRLNV